MSIATIIPPEEVLGENFPFLALKYTHVDIYVNIYVFDFRNLWTGWSWLRINGGGTLYISEPPNESVQA